MLFIKVVLCLKLLLAGQYKCALSAVNSFEIAHAISILNTHIQLKAVVEERDNQQRVVSNVISFPFLPAFHVHTTEIQLSNLFPQTTIRISASSLIINDLKVSFLYF